MILAGREGRVLHPVWENPADAEVFRGKTRY
jgi:hypothetical protein